MRFGGARRGQDSKVPRQCQCRGEGEYSIESGGESRAAEAPPGRLRFARFARATRGVSTHTVLFGNSAQE
jgi:hypothetical protein